MILEHSNYRSFLKAVLADKVAARESYSLRAFAQKLGVATSYLSEVLNEKKPLSTDAALRIAVKLGLSELECQYFCLLVQFDGEADPEHRIALQDRLNRINRTRAVHDLSSEAFRVISDWYHFAILELTYLPGFKLCPSAVSDLLGIARVEAEAAIERLVRLELLQAEGGQYRKTRGYVLAQSSVPNAAIRKFHRQLLEKAHACFDQQPTESRINCSQIIPVDSRDLDRLRAATERYLSEVIAISEQARVKDEVYALSNHFFKLTRLGPVNTKTKVKTEGK